MEKIILRPIFKEFLYKNKEENIYFDVYSYQGSTNQERNLGSLFVIGQIKYLDEDLSYLISLVSSLAKREYYSEKSLQEQNPKEAFSRSLKKLNEVLEEFFQNKNFKLNLGLVAIASENIYISRLGKFKINLARNGQLIDILNNIDLFRKETEGEKQFSHIISGKLQPGDKLFAFYPTRSITSREKQINEIFLKETQEEFGQKIANLAVNANNFSCCGLHLHILQTKEIPFQPKPKFAPPIISPPSADAPSKGIGEGQKIPVDTPVLTSTQENSQAKTQVKTDTPPQSSEPPIPEQPRIIPAELSVAKRGNIFTKAAIKLEKLRLVGHIKNKTGIRVLISVVLIAAVVLTLLVSLRSNSASGTKNVLTSINEKLKLAQSNLSQNNKKEARTLLQAALLEISNLPPNKNEKVKNEINQILTSLDRVSNKQPTLFLDLGDKIKNNNLSLLTASNNTLNLVASSGALFSVTPDNFTEMGKFNINPKFLFSSPSAIAVFDGLEKFAIFDLKSKNVALYSLKNPVSVSDAAVYEGNLYTLSESRIYKYADVLTGGVKSSEWINDSSSGRLIALTIDGNIFAINENGKLIKYFKGKKLGEFDLQLSPSAGSKIFTAKDSPFLHLADKTNKKVYVFDKSNGELKASYDLSPVGQIQDIYINQAGTIWILSTDKKVWQIQP